MLEKNKRRNDYWSITSIIDETKRNLGMENPTARDVLEYMLGDKDNWRNGSYVVYKYSVKKKRHFIQRLNMIWFYPLFAITIPFQYLFFGDIGVNRNSKVGKMVNWLVKLG